MRLFYLREVREAKYHAKQGGQALHLMYATNWISNVPLAFKRHSKYGHLLDANYDRLVATAKRLGVRCVVVCCPGSKDKQHVDLCGAPLKKAITEAIREL